jgi:hypothetical protein
MEYVPSSKIRREMPTLTNSIKRNELRLSNLSKPISLMKKLEEKSKDLEERIDKTVNEKEKSLLILELNLVKKQIDETKKLITVELEKEMSVLRGVIEKQKEELDLLNVKLEESLKYEEEVRVRKGITVCETIDIRPFFPNTIRLTINKGEVVEYLRSIDTNTVYLKISTMVNSESTNETPTNIVPVDYNTIFLNDGGRVIIDDSVKYPLEEGVKNVIGDAIKNPVNGFGSETNYISQVLNFNMDIVINPSSGFIVRDVDRNDGDLSVWVLSSSDGPIKQL